VALSYLYIQEIHPCCPLFFTRCLFEEFLGPVKLELDCLRSYSLFTANWKSWKAFLFQGSISHTMLNWTNCKLCHALNFSAQFWGKIVEQKSHEGGPQFFCRDLWIVKVIFVGKKFSIWCTTTSTYKKINPRPSDFFICH
jgi:hypothetical protein